MTSKNETDMNAGLGDISGVFKNQSVSDLSWLQVDEEEYRKNEALPKQNLDIVPDLQKALSMDEDGVPSATLMRPHVVVNRNPLEHHAASSSDVTKAIEIRTSRLVASSVDKREVLGKLSLEFSVPDLRIASHSIKKILSESGLIGNVYIDSSAFPRCASSKDEQKFAISSGKNALFVLSSDKCTGCLKNQGGCCSALGNKQIVDEVPYGSKLSAHYAVKLASEGRPLTLPSKGEVGKFDWKRSLQASFVSQVSTTNPDGVLQARRYNKKMSSLITEKDIEDFVSQKELASVQPKAPSPEFLKYSRRMMEGHDDLSYLASSLDKELSSLAGEYGVLGHSYVDVDAFGSCKIALDFINSKNDAFSRSRNDGVGIVPDYVIRRSSSCPHCKDVDGGPCHSISQVARILPSKVSLDRKAFASSLIRAVGRLALSKDKALNAVRVANSRKSNNWDRLVPMVNLLKASETTNVVSSTAGLVRSYALSNVSGSESIDGRELKNTVSHMMNTGLYGSRLKSAIVTRYAASELKNFPEVGSFIKQNSGVQGNFFIDPTAYVDYGSGCAIGSQSFRKRGAKSILAGDKCTGCMLQTHPGWCSKYAKDILKSIPDEFRQISDESAEASRVEVSTDTSNPVEQFGLASEEITIEPIKSPTTVDFSFSEPSIEL
jgi:hypothetical protein